MAVGEKVLPYGVLAQARPALSSGVPLLVSRKCPSQPLWDVTFFQPRFVPRLHVCHTLWDSPPLSKLPSQPEGIKTNPPSLMVWLRACALSLLLLPVALLGEVAVDIISVS